MAIDVKLSKLVASVQALRSLVTEKMPAKQAYRAARLARLVDAELADYHAAISKLIEKYHAAPGDTGDLVVPDENAQAFEQEFRELLETEVHLEVQPISLSAIEMLKVTPADLMLLDYVLVED